MHREILWRDFHKEGRATHCCCTFRRAKWSATSQTGIVGRDTKYRSSTSSLFSSSLPFAQLSWIRVYLLKCILETVLTISRFLNLTSMADFARLPVFYTAFTCRSNGTLSRITFWMTAWHLCARSTTIPRLHTIVQCPSRSARTADRTTNHNDCSWRQLAKLLLIVMHDQKTSFVYQKNKSSQKVKRGSEQWEFWCCAPSLMISSIDLIPPLHMSIITSSL